MKKIIILILFAAMSVNLATAQNPNVVESKAVFDLIFGPQSSNGIVINETDQQKAKMLLQELIQKSCQMSMAEGLLESAYSFDPSISGIVKSIISSYYTNCNEGAKNGKYYESVRTTIARNWKSAFAVRKQTDEW